MPESSSTITSMYIFSCPSPLGRGGSAGKCGGITGTPKILFPVGSSSIVRDYLSVINGNLLSPNIGILIPHLHCFMYVVNAKSISR